MKVRVAAIVPMVLSVIAAHPALASDNAREIAANHKVMHDFAKCVVASRHAKAAEVILTDVDNTVIAKRYSGLADGECLGRVAGSVPMRLGGDLFRYALADALFDADLARAAPTGCSTKPRLAHLPFPDPQLFDAAKAREKGKRKREELQHGYDNASAIAYLSSYGECIVRTNPVSARALLLAKPTKPEEMQAINALRPAFAECFTPGQTITFNKVVLRSTIAINYYRLAMSTLAPPLEPPRPACRAGAGVLQDDRPAENATQS